MDPDFGGFFGSAIKLTDGYTGSGALENDELHL